MPSLQVRDLPESLYEELRRCAVEQDRSISQQTVHLLRASLEAYRLRQENLGQMLAHDEGVAQIIQFLTMRSPHEDDQVAARIKRRKETFARIDKASAAICWAIRQIRRRLFVPCSDERELRIPSC